jgi:hypothetical protein
VGAEAGAGGRKQIKSNVSTHFKSWDLYWGQWKAIKML